MRSVIVLFAKAPIPGRVKTRLCPPLTPEQAAGLHEQFTRQMLSKLRSLADETGGATVVELHTDFMDCDAWRNLGVTIRVQCEGTLADRMLHAFRAVGAQAEKVMIVGSDAPLVPVEYLREILRLESDVMLGPAEDGGYYAIACRRVVEGMFAGVRWSTEFALEDTVRACEASGLRVSLGRTWWDVDTPEDLARLVELEKPDVLS